MIYVLLKRLEDTFKKCIIMCFVHCVFVWWITPLFVWYITPNLCKVWVLAMHITINLVVILISWQGIVSGLIWDISSISKMNSFLHYAKESLKKFSFKWTKFNPALSTFFITHWILKENLTLLKIIYNLFRPKHLVQDLDF